MLGPLRSRYSRQAVAGVGFHAGNVHALRCVHAASQADYLVANPVCGRDHLPEKQFECNQNSLEQQLLHRPCIGCDQFHLVSWSASARQALRAAGEKTNRSHYRVSAFNGYHILIVNKEFAQAALSI